MCLPLTSKLLSSNSTVICKVLPTVCMQILLQPNQAKTIIMKTSWERPRWSSGRMLKAAHGTPRPEPKRNRTQEGEEEQVGREFNDHAPCPFPLHSQPHPPYPTDAKLSPPHPKSNLYRKIKKTLCWNKRGGGGKTL